MRKLFGSIALFTWLSTSLAAEYDILIRNGTIYDGSGKPAFNGDLAIQGDSLAAIGNLKDAKGKTECDENAKKDFYVGLSRTLEEAINANAARNEEHSGNQRERNAQNHCRCS